MQSTQHIRILVCLFISVMVSTTSGCHRQSESTPEKQRPAEPDEPVVIATLLDLSGAQRSLGEPALKGFNLAIRSAGDAEPPITVTTIDTQTDPGATKRAAEQMAGVATVATGFTNNESLLIAGPLFQMAGKPFLSIGATDPALPLVIGGNVFLACFGDNAQAAAAAEFAAGEFGKSTVILWDETTQYTQTLPRYFRTRFEELGGDVLLDESYRGCDLTDLGMQIRDLTEKTDFIYLAAMPECAGELIASLRAAGIDSPIIGGDGLDTPELLRIANGATSGVWFTTHAWLAADTGTEQAQTFVRSYEAAYDEPPEDAFAALGYDAGKLLLDAIHRAEGTAPQQIRTALEATKDFEGVTGMISFSRDRHVPNKTVWIIEVEQGQRSLATSIVPTRVPPPLTPQK